jgi:para-aminobenzoate synthetase component 1
MTFFNAQANSSDEITSYFVINGQSQSTKKLFRSFLKCSHPRSAYLYYFNFKINLLTGQKKAYKNQELRTLLSHLTLDMEPENPLVIHLFYELSYLIHGFEKFIHSYEPLALIIDYQDFSIHRELDEIFKIEKLEKDLAVARPVLKSYPRFKDYKGNFKKIYEELLSGNCYQVNLTYPFYFSFDASIRAESYLYHLWSDQSQIGAYAHATLIPQLGKMYLSNSPECLFQIKGKNPYQVFSFPIKGTMSCDDGEFKKKKRELSLSQKNESELLMIADLIRHDLTKFSGEPSRVIQKKAFLKVPGLIHQFSKIKTTTHENKSVQDLLLGLFPGGSITGAPKKRVLSIIKQIEKSPRGFYCGSTILFHSSLLAASINIRSTEWNIVSTESSGEPQGELIYHAGGGITLDSKPLEEFEEMYQKLESFLSLF